MLSLGVSGVMTYVFLGVTARFLSLTEYGMVATLWSSTLLFAPVLWAGITQTLGRYVAEREARQEDWQPVISSARRLKLLLLAGFLVAVLLLSPVLTARIFDGEYLLTVAFMAAMACQSLNYFRRGLLSGHRQFSRVGMTFVVESVGRVLITAGLLVAGLGIIGPAAGIALAPLFSVLLVRVAPVAQPQKVGVPFDIGGTFRFALPILVSMFCAQTIVNGGAILITGLGGTNAYAQAGLLVAALALVRAPQSLLSPAVSSLLPHLSRIAALNDYQRMSVFVWKAVAIVSLVGVVLVGGMWLLGEFAMRLVYGSKFAVSQELLTVLAMLAAFYLLCELLNQVLFARGLAWGAVASWVLGVFVAIGATLVLQNEILSRVSYALTFATISVAVTQMIFLFKSRHRTVHDGTSLEGSHL